MDVKQIDDESWYIAEVVDVIQGTHMWHTFTALLGSSGYVKRNGHMKTYYQLVAYTTDGMRGFYVRESNAVGKLDIRDKAQYDIDPLWSSCFAGLRYGIIGDTPKLKTVLKPTQPVTLYTPNPNNISIKGSMAMLRTGDGKLVPAAKVIENGRVLHLTRKRERHLHKYKGAYGINCDLLAYFAQAEIIILEDEYLKSVLPVHRVKGFEMDTFINEWQYFVPLSVWEENRSIQI